MNCKPSEKDKERIINHANTCQGKCFLDLKPSPGLLLVAEWA